MEENNVDLKKVSLEELDLTYVNNKGKVKMIKWGKDYFAWDMSRKVEYLEALASAMNEAARVAYEERDKAWERVDQLVAVEAANKQGLEQAKTLYKQAFDRSNEVNQQRILAEQKVNELEKTLKALSEEVDKAKVSE